MEVLYMRKSLSLTVAIGIAVALLTAPTAGAATKISNGAACTKIGASTTVAGYAYKCAATVKSNLKIAGDKSIVFVPVKNTSVKNAKKTWISTTCITSHSKAQSAQAGLAAIKKSSDEKLVELDAQIAGQNALLVEAKAKTPILEAQIVEATVLLEEATKKLAEAEATAAAAAIPDPDNATAIVEWKARIKTLQEAITLNQTLTRPDNISIAKWKEVLADAAISIAKWKVALADANKKLSDLTLAPAKQKIANATTVSSWKTTINTYKTTIRSSKSALTAYATAGKSITSIQKLRDGVAAQYGQAVTMVNDSFDQRNLICSEGL